MFPLLLPEPVVEQTVKMTVIWDHNPHVTSLWCLSTMIMWGMGCLLTHWGRDKIMAAISQTILSNAFPCMKMLEFRLKFCRILFLRVQLTIFQHWFRQWLGVDLATSHYQNQWWLDYWRIYVSLRLNELTLIYALCQLLHLCMKYYIGLS